MGNLAGQLQASHDGDPIGISCLSFPPFSQTCDAGFAFGGDTTVDGTAVASAGIGSRFQWFAHQILRETTVVLDTVGRGAVTVTSTTRMPFDERAVLIQVELSDNSTAGEHQGLNVSLSLSAFLGNYSGTTWGWPVPRPSASAGSHSATLSHDARGAPLVTVKDHQTGAEAVIGFAGVLPSGLVPKSPGVYRADYQTVGGGQRRHTVINLIICVGNAVDDSALKTRVSAYSSGFNATFAAAAAGWQSFWDGSFTPNASFPGNLPLLQTQDLQLSRTYYMGLL